MQPTILPHATPFHTAFFFAQKIFYLYKIQLPAGYPCGFPWGFTILPNQAHGCDSVAIMTSLTILFSLQTTNTFHSLIHFSTSWNNICNGSERRCFSIEGPWLHNISKFSPSAKALLGNPETSIEFLVLSWLSQGLPLSSSFHPGVMGGWSLEKWLARMQLSFVPRLIIQFTSGVKSLILPCVHAQYASCLGSLCWYAGRCRVLSIQEDGQAWISIRPAEENLTLFSVFLQSCIF